MPAPQSPVSSSGPSSLSRRAFLVTSAAAAGGLSLGFSLPLGEPDAIAAEAGAEVNAWVVIRPDDSVLIRIARSEMGQGTLTGLAQLVAEELQCDWSKVTTEFPSPGENQTRNRVWGNFSTGGSRGIRESQQYVREGGAAAREMLIEAAALAWKVPPADCVAAAGVITHKPSGRKTTYGKMAAAAGKLTPPKTVSLKDPKDWTIAGKGLKRLDTAPKVTGQQVYGIDLKLPGMLVATIRDCPVNGGRLAAFDAAKVTGMPGVKRIVAVDQSAVAVIADSFWHAKSAIDALPVTWDPGDGAKVSSATIAAMLAEGLDAEQAFIGNKAGDAKAAIAGAAKTVEAVYGYPFLNHATMEPMNATALYKADRCEVWAPTQNGEAALAVAAEAAELPVSRCDVHKMILGGGFGRRGRSDYVRQAVLIARQIPGTPVKLIWTREEDMTHCSYHPISQCKMTGGLDAAGNLVGLHMRLSGQSILASLMPQNLQNGMDPVTFQGLNPGGAESAFAYDIPNLLIDHAMRNTHLTVGFWRGVNTNHNAIYVESFMDELADAAGQDPLEFRRKYLRPKHRAVLDAVAERAGWGKPPAGHYQGLAQIMGFGSYVAACAEVSVSPEGKLRIHKIVAATNPGVAVNPAQIERQVAGSFVYGLSALLYGECTVKDGVVEQTNFDSYKVLRMDEMPEVEAHIVATGEFWGGVGEPTIAVAAPAVLNAIFRATGKRIRSVPLSHHDLKRA
ncbi:molybdopterin cofactor-binding domain-containing protein [Telmatospirillum sp.]|uniref:xanthine dehydrogenase family protein molybdopterin-binding subunit n=1 Tax=Telmatospirillum sp. TaxID=2079197 RepID=UPI00283C1B2A|nr:molybdopterin cofactor-binding domain-containing protein [Telmatospirillum sp.]MDR3435523.1 molybdopterin-dependent oxidoreductase [Telmatospirillum sp.]